MLLLDCLYINSGGGKKLLDLIIEYLNSNSIDTHFLLDERVEAQYNHLPKESKTFCAPSLIRRHLFYKTNHDKFTSVLVFNNIPPSINLSIPVYTYFHNILYLNVNPIDNFYLFLKSLVIRFFKKNTDKWIVQSYFVKNSLHTFWKINLNEILVLPIFDEKKSCIKNIEKRNNNSISFLYVSDGHIHKNHLRLFEAFEQYWFYNKNCSLTVTISDSNTHLKQIISKLNEKGIPINNIGFVSNNKLIEYYVNTDIVIYPSLNESFGLGLVEAANYNLPIIASNLPYVFEIVEPNLIFDPFSSKDILAAFIKSKQILGCKSKIKTKNKISDLFKEVSRSII